VVAAVVVSKLAAVAVLADMLPVQQTSLPVPHIRLPWALLAAQQQAELQSVQTADQARLVPWLLRWEADMDPATRLVQPTAADQAEADLATRLLRSMHLVRAQQDRVSSAVLVCLPPGQVAAVAVPAAQACLVPQPTVALAEQAVLASNG
jgi:hypothetical protein